MWVYKYDFVYSIIHCKLIDLTNIKVYGLHAANCLQNIWARYDFFKEKVTFSFDKQSMP